MSSTTLWFFGAAVVVFAAWMVGRGLGRGPVHHSRCAIVVAVIALVAWAWLMKHPATAVRVLPVGVLSRIEGFGAVPLFALVLGIAWSRSKTTRQRHAIGWAMLLGALIFVNGGAWLLQPTPSTVLGHTLEAEHVAQTQDYSCVPAACATALNMLGHGSTEAQMAELTQTRPGTGATIIRALDGLNKRLAGQRLKPHLIEPDWLDMQHLPMPALTPLQFESTRRHMVTLTRISRDEVWFIDPTNGYQSMTRDEFLMVYKGHLIVFQ